jgi:hypothetical protein
MPLFDNIDNVGRFKEGIKNSVVDQGTTKTVFTGIVVDIDRYGGRWTRPKGPTAPNTIKVYIPELDSNFDYNSLNYFEPYLPIHLSPVPEIKEEVLITFDSPLRKEGWWIKRNDSNLINYTEMNKVLGDVPNSQKYGADIMKDGQIYEYKESDDSPDKEMKIPLYRRKPGDVPIEGRSNTLIQHTFSLNSKKGIIDIVSERTGETNYGDTDISNIKQREFQDTQGTRIFVATKHNIDDNNDWKLINTPGFKYHDMTESANVSGDTNQHKETSYLYAESGQFRFVSRDSEEKLNNAVLGNNMEVWLCSLFDVLEQMTNIIADSPAKQIVITQGVPNAINLMSGGMQAVRQKLTQLRKEIYRHHSKTLFLN